MANQKTYKILERDPYLADFAGDIELRMRLYQETKKRILGKEKKISSFANGNLYYGFHQEGDTWVYREWAPGEMCIRDRPKAETAYTIRSFASRTLAAE